MAEIICAICGAKTSKRKTLSIGDGKRACRTHDETQTAAKEIRDKAVEEKLEQARKEAEKRNWRKRQDQMTLDPFKPRCMCCLKEGMREPDFFRRLLIEQAKWKLITGKDHNPFNPEEVRKSAGPLVGTRVLHYVQWHGKNAKVKVPYNCWMAADLVGFIAVCSDCVKKKGFTTYMEEQPPIEFDDLIKHAAVYETLIGPIHQQIAAAELMETN